MLSSTNCPIVFHLSRRIVESNMQIPPKICGHGPLSLHIWKDSCNQVIVADSDPHDQFLDAIGSVLMHMV